jgi:hypothetical protein
MKYFRKCQTDVYSFYTGSYKGHVALSVHVFPLSRSEAVHRLSQTAVRTSLHFRPIQLPTSQFSIIISKPRRCVRSVRQQAAVKCPTPAVVQQHLLTHMPVLLLKACVCIWENLAGLVGVLLCPWSLLSADTVATGARIQPTCRRKFIHLTDTISLEAQKSAVLFSCN